MVRFFFFFFFNECVPSTDASLRVVIGSLSGVRKVALSQKYIVKVTFPEEVLDKIFCCKGLGTHPCFSLA